METLTPSEIQKERKRKELARELAAKRLSRAYSDVLSSISGRLVLWDIMSKGGLIAADASGMKPEELAYSAGARSVALQVLNTAQKHDKRFFAKAMADFHNPEEK